VAGAVFNATLSSLMGIFLTPLWVAWVIKTSGQSVPVGPVILDLLRWLVLPLAVGQALHPWLGGWVGRHKSSIGLVDRGAILLLVYTSFCDSFKQGVWTAHGIGEVMLITGVCAGLFALVMPATAASARAWSFSREDRIAATFCGSKKTLASGCAHGEADFRRPPRTRADPLAADDLPSVAADRLRPARATLGQGL
jgi:sodium/bile acid cotransporter 7